MASSEARRRSPRTQRRPSSARSTRPAAPERSTSSRARARRGHCRPSSHHRRQAPTGRSAPTRSSAARSRSRPMATRHWSAASATTAVPAPPGSTRAGRRGGACSRSWSRPQRHGPRAGPRRVRQPRLAQRRRDHRADRRGRGPHVHRSRLDLHAPVEHGDHLDRAAQVTAPTTGTDREIGAGDYGSAVWLSRTGSTRSSAATATTPASERPGSTATRPGPGLSRPSSSPTTGPDAGVGTPTFGSAVSLSDDAGTALIGGQSDNQRGAAWVFTRTTATAWSERQKLVAPSSGAGAEVGQGFFGRRPSSRPTRPPQWWARPSTTPGSEPHTPSRTPATRGRRTAN